MANPTLTERAEHKEAGFQAVQARDMAADAQRLGSEKPPLPPQEEQIEFKKPAANDNFHPRTGAPGAAPKPIPPPNESYEELKASAQSRNAPSAPPMPGPSDSVPAASSPKPIANDNTMSGPN